jgi:formate dehydrogenase major subunit
VDLNRRDFLKLSGVGLVGAVTLSAMPDTQVMAAKKFPLPDRVSETQTICCYCSVGCGAIVTAWGESGRERMKIEGDPDHPINQGSLCPKGMAMYQVHEVDGELNSERLTRILHREPGATDWDEKEYDWDEMLDMIARRVKTTRDETFVGTDENGKTVNRLDRMGSLGGGELDNEECYLLAKMNRALGVVYLEHCARL